MNMKLLTSALALSVGISTQALAFGIPDGGAGGSGGSCCAAGPTFTLDGYASYGGFDTFSDGWAFVDLQAAAKFELGSVDIALGVAVDGYMVGGADIVAAMPYVTLFTDYGNFSVGGIGHASQYMMPEVRIGASRFIDHIISGPFMGHHSFLDILTPSEEVVYRYDGHFGNFMVSASHGDRQNSSIMAGYDFGTASVFFGVDAVGDFAAVSYIIAGAASFGPVDVATRITTPLGTTSTWFSATTVSYEVMDQVTLNASLVTAPGLTNFGGFVEYEPLNGIILAAGYNDLGGGGMWSASVTVPFGNP